LPPASDDEAFWDQVRKQFEQPSLTYFNTGTLGLMPFPVRTEIQNRLDTLAKGKYAVDDAPRTAVAHLYNVLPDTISLTHNTTEGINIVAQGLRLRRGDEVIMSDQEHVGNALPWLNRARLSGIKLRIMTPAPTAAETLDRIAALVTRRTRMIALPHVTCTAGHVLPVKEIAQFAREKGILSFFDGAHGPGMMFPDMEDIGCDFYAACGHKWLCGPAGTGMLYLRPDALPKVEGLMVGAYSDQGWELSLQTQNLTGLVANAHRFDYGTQNVALLQGLKAAITFMNEIGYAKVRDRVATLGGYLQNALLERSYIDMITPTEAISRAGIIGFRIKGRSLAEVDQWAISQNFRIRLVQESHLDSLRISTHILNSYADLDRLIKGLDDFAQH
jgi:cysteine desulfurase / selenocysteine lyase